MSPFNQTTNEVRMLRPFGSGAATVAHRPEEIAHRKDWGESPMNFRKLVCRVCSMLLLILAVSSLFFGRLAHAQEKIASTKWMVVDKEEPLGTGEIGDWEYDSQGWVYVVEFTRDEAEQVEMLWQQLRKNYLAKGITTMLDGGGTAVKGTMRVTLCPDISHKKDKLAAYKAGFFVHAIADFGMGLKERNGFSMQSSDATAQVWNKVKTTVFAQKQDILINWDPKTSLLSIRTIRFGYPEQSGPQPWSGIYNVTGVSTISTLSKNATVNSQFSAGKEKFDSKFSMNATMAAAKKSLKVVLGGYNFDGKYGDVFLIRRSSPYGGVLELSFGAEWLTDIESSIKETHASVTTAKCTSTKQSSFDVSVTDVFGLGFDHSTSDVCVANKAQLPVFASWSAQPIYNELTDTHEGLSCRMRFNVEWVADDEAMYYQSFYDVRSTTGLTLLLDVSVADDKGKGHGFTVANKSNYPQQSDIFHKVSTVFE